MSHISRQIRQKTNEQGSETKRVKREREGLVGGRGWFLLEESTLWTFEEHGYRFFSRAFHCSAVLVFFWFFLHVHMEKGE